MMSLFEGCLNTSHLDSNLKIYNLFCFCAQHHAKGIHFFGSTVTSRKATISTDDRFNIRHMSGVFSGLLQAKPGEFAEAEKARKGIFVEMLLRISKQDESQE